MMAQQGQVSGKTLAGKTATLDVGAGGGGGGKQRRKATGAGGLAAITARVRL